MHQISVIAVVGLSKPGLVQYAQYVGKALGAVVNDCSDYQQSVDETGIDDC